METELESRRVARHYDRAASLYRAGFLVLSLGAGPEMQRRAVAALRLRPGDTVLDLGCGTGMLFANLAEQVGAKGQIIGVDVSPKMVGLADKLVRDQQLASVQLVCEDVMAYQPAKPVDGVVFCLSLSTMPDPEAILRRAVSFLKPGGRLVVVDSLTGAPSQTSLASLYIRLKAKLVQSRPESRIIEVARETLDGLTISIHNYGIYTLLAGRRPA